MATVVVSGTGGNWSSTATWVGGALPAVGDDIVANATSGPLTVDSTRTCLTINFTNYTNVFTINNGFTLNITGTTITLGSGMTYTQGTTGVLSTSAGNQSTINIAFNGVIIPRLTIGKSAAPLGQNIIISGPTPTVQHLVCQSGAAIVVSLAGVNLTVTTSLSIPAANSPLTGLPLTIAGTCTFNTVGNISGGFNVTAGSRVILANTLRVGGGTVTFAVGSFLTDTSFGISVNFSTSVLNTAPVTWYSFTQTSSGTTFITSNLNIGDGGINVGALGSFIFNGAFNVNVSGNVVAPTITLSSSTLNLTGVGRTLAITGIINGTVNIATGTSYNISGATLSLNGCVFNLVGTATCSVPAVHTLTLTSATLTTNNTSTGANIVGGSEIQWKNVSIAFTNTITYTTTVLGNLAGTNATTVVNTGKMLVYGNLSMLAGTAFSGTSIIEFTGSVAATWGAGIYQNNIVINKGGGTVTLPTAGTITWGFAARSLTYTSGIINTSTSTLVIPVSTGVTMSGMPFYNLTLPGTATYVINSPLSILNNLTLGSTGNTFFTGSAGWTCANLLCPTPGRIITLANSSSGASYRTTSTASLTATSASRITMTSDNAITQSIWTLDNGAQQSLVYVNGTRIDSSQGATVWSFGGALTSTSNWGSGSAPATTAYTYVC
jgi:hypothetical protein